MPPNFSNSSQRIYLLGVVGLLLVLSIGMTFPLILHLADAVPGWEGDNVFFVWEIWWVKHALIDLHTSPFFSSLVYFPYGYELARDELTLSNTLLGLPFTISMGAVVTYNLMTLLSFALSGFGAYLWMFRLTGQRGAALLGGIAFAFLPYRFAHLAGHLNLLATQWIPLTLAAFDGLFWKPTLRRGATAGILLSLIILSAWYYAFFAALIVPIYTLARWRISDRSLRDKAVWRSLSGAGIIAALIVLPFALPSVQIASSENFSRSLAAVEYWSLNPYDYLIPNRLNPWWGAAVASQFPRQSKLWVAFGITLSYMVLALGGIALWQRAKKPLLPLVLALLAAYLISLGPTLHWNDQQVRLPLPRVVNAALTQLGVWAALGRELNSEDMRLLKTESDVAIPLPTLAIHLWLPFGRGLRSMDRMAIWVALMVTGLAAMGFVALQSWLEQRQLSPIWRHALWAAVALIILLESYSTYGITDAPATSTTLTPRSVDLWLAQQPANTVVFEFPWWRHILDYYGTIHQQPVIFGAIGAAYPPALLQERMALVNEFPSARSVAALKQWQVSYLLFTVKDIPQWDAWQERIKLFPELQTERVFDGVWVYRVSYN